MSDDGGWPTGLPRDGARAESFRRWRERNPERGVEAYDEDAWRRREEDALARGLPAPPETADEWRQLHDDGYLSPDDEAAVRLGGVPAPTLKRLARWLLPGLGFVCALLAWVEHAEGMPFFGWPLALLGGAVLFFGLTWKLER